MTIVLELKCGTNGFRAHPVKGKWIYSGNSRVLHLFSEDILTANVFGVLNNLDPRAWMVSFLEHACNFSRAEFSSLYEQNNFDEFTVLLWQDLDQPPGTLEGITQADVLIKLRNAAVLIECKGLSSLQARVSTDERKDDPKLWWDQAIRNIVRGYAYTRRHFGYRSFFFVVLSMSKKEETFSQYENWVRIKEQVERRMGKDHDLGGIFPKDSVDDICKELSRQIRWVEWSELKEALKNCTFDEGGGYKCQSRFRDDLVNYLDFKIGLWSSLPKTSTEIRSRGGSRANS